MRDVRFINDFSRIFYIKQRYYLPVSKSMTKQIVFFSVLTKATLQQIIHGAHDTQNIYQRKLKKNPISIHVNEIGTT